MEAAVIRYPLEDLIAELRRQAALRNATWPCVLLSDLMPLCDRMDVLEREHAEFFERWHDERRKREALEQEAINTLQAGMRLALELECLLMDTRDTAIQSKWWDSAHEALEQWRTFVSTPPEATAC